MKRVGTVFAVLLIMAAPAVFGGDSGTATGRFATHTTSTDSTDLPDGGRVDVVHYNQFAFSDQPGHPIDNTTADCVGRYLFSNDGAVEAASGICFATDAGGNLTSFWWRFDEAATANCPLMCGSWGYFDGTGKYKGVSGTGTWKQSSVFGDDGVGTWKGSFSTP